MPISPIVLQRRQAELGRIRLGQKQTTSNGKTRPAKLEKFRFTSVSKQYIEDLANLYGGTAQAWDNNGIASWEVLTTATSIPVIVVKNGLSQWMETWSGGGCTHRCDGQVNTLTNEACDPNDPAHVAAKPTTRLSVMLPELEAIGVFRMESHGWNAAAEIPAVAELAQFVGDLVPAVLHLVERRAIKDGQTSRFVVPVLDLKIGAAKLREIVEAHAGVGELEAPAASSAPAIDAGKQPDYLAQAKKAKSTDQINTVWKAANDAGHMTDELYAELQRLGSALKGAPAIEGTIELEPPDVLWNRCLKAAGDIGWTLDDVEKVLLSDHFVTPQGATSEQLDALLTRLENEEAA